MITVLLIVHGLLAVALLGALTHQSFAVLRAPSHKRGFVDRFRSVSGPTFVFAVILIFLVTSLGGGLLYPQYRIDVRTTLEDLQLRAANGVFEIKEHVVAVGLGLLPAYAYFWRLPLDPSMATARRAVTWMLAGIVWWSYLVGHVLNNIKGLL